MIEADLLARVSADDAALTAIGVDADGGVKLYPNEAPQGAAPPYVVYRRLDSTPVRTMGDDSVDAVTLHFEAHATRYSDALAIAAALRAALDPWRTDAPSRLMAMSYAGEHDGAGEYDEAARRRRTFCREVMFTAHLRA